MLSRSMVYRELRRVRRAKTAAESEDDKWIAYGAEQALSWALGQDAAPPHVLIQITAGADQDE